MAEIISKDKNSVVLKLSYLDAEKLTAICTWIQATPGVLQKQGVLDHECFLNGNTHLLLSNYVNEYWKNNH